MSISSAQRIGWHELQSGIWFECGTVANRHVKDQSSRERHFQKAKRSPNVFRLLAAFGTSERSTYSFLPCSLEVRDYL